MNWKKYTSEERLNMGDIIQLAGDYYHIVIRIHEQATQTRIDVSESAATEADAILSAQQAALIEG